MKIDIVVQNYPPERMAAHYTSDLAEALAAQGHDTRVVTALPHAPTGKSYPGHGTLAPTVKVESQVKVWRVPIVRASNRQVSKRILGFATFMLSAACASLLGRRPDVVIVSLPSILVWPALLVLSKLRRIPTVLLLRDVEPLISFQLRQLEQAWWAKVLIDIWCRLYACADSVVLVHESQRTSLPARLFEGIPINVIDHGADLDRMLNTTPADGIPQLQKFHGDDLLVVYTGTFGVAQDLARLVESLADDALRTLPVSFAFIGDGEQYERIRQLKIEHRLDRLFLHPPVSRQQVPGLLQQADVLLMSYKLESQHIAGMIGSKFYEYCASGKPIVVFGHGVASRLVDTIGNGWRCDAGTAAGFSEQMNRILATADRAARGERGREYAKTHYDKKQRHQRWTRLIEASIKRRR